jgi:hypothetical protein
MRGVTQRKPQEYIQHLTEPSVSHSKYSPGDTDEITGVGTNNDQTSLELHAK